MTTKSAGGPLWEGTWGDGYSSPASEDASNNAGLSLGLTKVVRWVELWGQRYPYVHVDLWGIHRGISV